MSFHCYIQTYELFVNKNYYLTKKTPNRFILSIKWLGAL